MASPTDIANLALLHMGVTKRIGNLETERSVEADALRTAYIDDRNYTLRDFPWPWATAYVALGLVSDPVTPYNGDWRYAYRYPANCLFLRRLVGPAGRNETRRIEYRIGRDSGGRLVLSNCTPLTVEYTAVVEDAQEFDAIYVSMLSWKLAASCGVALSRIAQIETRAMQMYEIEKTKAQSRALNEGQEPPEPDAEWIRSR